MAMVALHCRAAKFDACNSVAEAHELVAKVVTYLQVCNEKGRARVHGVL